MSTSDFLFVIQCESNFSKVVLFLVANLWSFGPLDFQEGVGPGIFMSIFYFVVAHL